MLTSRLNIRLFVLVALVPFARRASASWASVTESERDRERVGSLSVRDMLGLLDVGDGGETQERVARVLEWCSRGGSPVSGE